MHSAKAKLQKPKLQKPKLQRERAAKEKAAKRAVKAKLLLISCGCKAAKAKLQRELQSCRYSVRNLQSCIKLQKPPKVRAPQEHYKAGQSTTEPWRIIAACLLSAQAYPRARLRTPAKSSCQPEDAVRRKPPVLTADADLLVSRSRRLVGPPRRS